MFNYNEQPIMNIERDPRYDLPCSLIVICIYYIIILNAKNIYGRLSERREQRLQQTRISLQCA